MKISMSIARPTRPQQKGFTVREAARRTGIPLHTVSYYGGKWGRAGYGRLIKPELADAGQGTAKVFSVRNLVQLRVAFLLRGTGLPEDETRHLLSAKGVGGKDWWDPTHSLGPDALLLVRGEPHLPATDNWTFLGGNLRGTPPDSWAAAVFQAAGPEFELVQARYPSGWQPRLKNDDRDCWVLRGARRVWVINIGQIRKAVAQ
jgi:DNA-binding transcriptional MerR regulator